MSARRTTIYPLTTTYLSWVACTPHSVRLEIVMNPVTSPTYLYSRRKTEDEHGERANHRVFNCQIAFTRLLTEFRDSLLNMLEIHRFHIPQLSGGVTRPLGVDTATLKST